jgi:hypothetical protein
MECSWSGFYHPIDTIWKEVCGRATLTLDPIVDFITLMTVDDDSTLLEIHPTQSS